MRSVLLDTNAYAALLRGDDRVRVAVESAERVLMSVFVLGELHAGFRRGSKLTQNLRILGEFLLQPTVSVLDATRETAEVFGHVKQTLTRAGRPIPITDVWIAAHAVDTGSVVVSFDRHFLEVPGLRVWPELV